MAREPGAQRTASDSQRMASESQRMASDFAVRNGGVVLSGEHAGEGPAVVLLHGLTATRRYVVMGSRLLERSGYRTIAYDARGHGRSTPAPERTRYG
jgi:pimeloyl-ACP methyl ester carboxylesterase